MKDQGKIIIALLAGAAVGAAVALLLAPSSGSELREDIADYFDDLAGTVRDKAESAANSVREYSNNAVERSRSKFRSAVNDLSNYKESVADKVRTKANNAVEAIEHVKSRVKGAADDANDAIQDA